jgi:hypothetical protein
MVIAGLEFLDDLFVTIIAGFTVIETDKNNTFLEHIWDFGRLMRYLKQEIW